MTTSDTMARPDYGIDAPGLIRKMFLVGTGALLLLLPAAFGFWPGRLWGVLLAELLLVCAAYLLGMGCLMLYSSRFSKLRERETLLDLISLSGREHILDVGCGRGLMLIGAAKRLRDGKAVGIDLWQAEDQADNRPDATVNNARLEGVVERVEVHTADMRQLPFPDQSFDAVVSHWAVHNLRNAKERARTLAEIHRVLKPGGQVILADIEHRAEYAAGFARLGFTDIQHVGASWQTAFLSAVSFGSFCPTAVFARKSVTQSIC
jgi:ubiquinone/menaquinone biosynthesis C-methylase UbiE